MARVTDDQLGSVPDPVTLLTVARWRTAEEQLFTGLIHDPVRYQRAILLLAAIAEDIEMNCPTRQSALEADPGLVAATAAAAHQAEVTGLDLDQVGAAAMANYWWRLDVADGQSGSTGPDDDTQNGLR